MSAPEIRPTIEADLPAITAIYQQAVREGTATFELEPPDLSEMTRRYRALVDGGYPYFVAILEGRVAGYAYAGAYRPRPAYRFTVENSIYLDPSFHRRGIGRRLLEALLDEAAQRGARQVLLEVAVDNAPAQKLYAQYGFEAVGIRRGYYQPSNTDALVMMREH